MKTSTALRLVTPMTENDDRENRKTDPVHVAPDDPIDFRNPEFPKSAIVPSLGAHPSMIEDSIRALSETSKRLEAHYETLLDPEGALAKQTAQISALISANYGLIHEQVRGLVHAVDSLVIRVRTVETLRETDGDHLKRLESDMSMMKIQFDRIEAEVTKMRAATPTQ